MEDILSERFQYATITTYKDYCNINDKSHHQNSMNGNMDWADDVFDGNYLTSSGFSMSTPKGSLVSLPEKRGKRKVNFFNDDKPVQERFYLEYGFPKYYSGYDTTSDRQIKRHFGKPFSGVTITTTERSIRRHGDKITIKSYHSQKTRSFNCIYYRKSFIVNSVTFNLKTGNFTTLIINKNGKKKSQTFTTNHFLSLLKIVMSRHLFMVKKSHSKNSRVHDEFLQCFNDDLFFNTMKEALNVNSTLDYNEDLDHVMVDFMDVFIKLKNIKVPDEDYDYLLVKLYPTEKYFKKNDRKLVASVLDMLGIKSKLTIKILHENPMIDILSLHRFIKYFDNDYTKYLGNVNPEVFKSSFRKDSIYSMNDWTSKFNILNDPYSNRVKCFGLNDMEKENLIKIVNTIPTGNRRINGLSPDFIQLMDDHISMVDRLREYDPELTINAKSIDEFYNEHSELSKMITAIKKGWVVEYQYDQKTIDVIEQPLNCLYDNDTLHVLYPVILKREEEYGEEGSFMHHCVASYANKDTSIIISLRDKSGGERVTCEYQIETGRCLQKRYFCNANPPSSFEDGLLLLTEKVAQMARWGTLNWKEKKKVPVKINGVEICETLPTVRVTDIFQDVNLPFNVHY